MNWKHKMMQIEILFLIHVSIFLQHVLPSVLEQVIQCHDVIAQEYLMDVIIQVSLLPFSNKVNYTFLH